jgi:RND family efflux transporter MFP subunit
MTGLVLLVAATVAAQPGLATVAQRVVAAEHTAYARVEPIRTITLSAVVAGTVSGLSVVPGTSVRAGETLATISGPEQAAEIERARAAEAEARASLTLAEKTAKAVESTYPDLSTGQQVDETRAAVEKARAALEVAKAAVANQEHAHAVVAPDDATVLVTSVANGDRVVAGSPLFRLEPRGKLWVRASFYGVDSRDLEVGMRGAFEPASGGAAVPVEVRSVIAPLEPDGGRGVGCTPKKGAELHSGEMGTLRLTGPPRTWAAVPTAALVLNQGEWWVLVQEAKGPRPQKVEIGPAQGGWTLVRRGLEPGQRVIVADAYLVFHRDFAKQYQPPD